jgi:hypothetical protein
MYREDFERTGTPDRNGEDVFSKPVRAGKRTYFFDVKATKGNNDFYLTITESKRKKERDGSFSFDKHKIFLYKEDFARFMESMHDVIGYVEEQLGTIEARPEWVPEARNAEPAQEPANEEEEEPKKKGLFGIFK